MKYFMTWVGYFSMSGPEMDHFYCHFNDLMSTKAPQTTNAQLCF